MNTLYEFNYSQDIINLQTKYSLFGRVANIVFSTVVENGFDTELMARAINTVIARNDSLRIKFHHKDKKIFQTFESEKVLSDIKTVSLRTQTRYNSFLSCFRARENNLFKGETLKVVFTVNPDGKQEIFFKISHYVADTYGIAIVVNDIFAVYKALANGESLPPAPGQFEDVIKKDIEAKHDSVSVQKDLDFFKNCYVGKPHPTYCGLHGNGSDRWLKNKAKDKFSLPYLFIKCDTQGYKLHIPASLNTEVMNWCTENGITPSAFYFYTMSLASSRLNDKQKYLAPLMLLDCRGTLAERKAAGTKVQCISVYTTVDYEKSFKENIALEYAQQNQLFRHTKLTYLEVEAIQHKEWNYSLLSQITNFSYSFIPFNAPEGVKLQIHSNGKGALVAYIALMWDTRTNAIDVAYDVQTKMITPVQLMDYHNLFLETVEAVIKDSTTPLNKLF